MSKNILTPQFSVINGDINQETSLLDSMMQRSKENLKNEGVDIDKLSQKTNAESRYWEELDAVFVNVRDKLCGYLLQVTQDYAALSQLPLDNMNELAVTVNAFRRDMDELSKKLLEIHSRHANKSHVVADEEYTLFIAVFNDYAATGENVALSVAPVVMEMTDFALKAKQLIAEQEKELESTNKDVVTDVAFKEV